MRLSRKLGVVTRHEYATIVKQPSFWAVLILIPAIIAGIFLVSFLSDRSSRNDEQNANAKDKQVVLIDQSGIIKEDIAKQVNVTVNNDANKDEQVQKVRSGELDGLIYYPKDITDTKKFETYANNDEESNGAIVSNVGKLVLQQSVLSPLGSPELQALATDGGSSEGTTFKDGKENKGIGGYIIPGSFLLMFYLVLVFSVSYALTSVSDEKENRSIEMVLSYIKPQTLILGKLFGVILVTLTQLLFFGAVGAIGYGVARAFGNQLSLPFSISDVTIDPTALLFGLAFLIIGFVFYVGLMATTGAVFPSAKDAGGFTTVFFIAAASPFWVFQNIMNNPDSPLTQFMTYFPLSAPTTSLIRNTFGNLSVIEGLISLAILIVATIVTIMLAGRAFRLGTLEFNSRIKLSQLVRK